jgi:hypothetical protein
MPMHRRTDVNARAATMRVLDADGREALSAIKGDKGN